MMTPAARFEEPLPSGGSNAFGSLGLISIPLRPPGVTHAKLASAASAGPIPRIQFGIDSPIRLYIVNVACESRVRRAAALRARSHLANRAVVVVGHVDRAGRVHRDPGRTQEPGRGAGAIRRARR